MKNKLLLVATSLALSSCATQKESVITTSKVKTTAYTHNEADHLRYGKKTAIGTTLKEGVVATDWSVYPVDSILLIDGVEYTVEDYGSALVGKDVPVVDVYVPSFSRMYAYGAQHHEVQVVKWGDWERSRTILQDRQKYKHCRQMLNNMPANDT